jgi:hypothetical protein
MKSTNKLTSNHVFVDKFGTFKFIYDFYGEINGVYEFDRILEFYTIENKDEDQDDNYYDDE